MDNKALEKSINNFWDSNITPTLTEYIKIPNKSPSFDPDWKKNGHMDKVLKLATNWTKKHLPSDGSITIKPENDEVLRLKLEYKKSTAEIRKIIEESSKKFKAFENWQ